MNRRPSPRFGFAFTPLALVTLALAWPAPGWAVDPPALSSGAVPVDQVQRRIDDAVDKAVKAKTQEIDTLRKRLSALEDDNKRLKAQLTQSPPDPEAAKRQEKAEAGLALARQRMAQLEAQLKTLEAQRDEALAEAKAAARKNNAADSKAEVALRRERDRLKAALDDEERNTAQLRTELQGSQKEVSRLRQEQAGATANAASSARAAGALAAQTAATALRDGQELTVPGCHEKCSSFIVLPQVGRVTMGTGNEARTVEFKHRLAMGKTEITVAQWRHFMADSGYRLPPSPYTYCDWEKSAVSERHPVRCINAQDADAYAKWFNGKYAGQLGLPRLQAVLPTEEEWEYAARAGRWTQERQWDSGIQGGRKNCDFAGSHNCTGSTPDPVAKTGRKPNAWGLYDTMGNVWEWTSTAGSGGGSRVVRGGSFGSIVLRLSTCFAITADCRDSNVGLRLLARIDL